MNVYTLSDLHIDYEDNFRHLLSLHDPDYQQAALIISGDVSDNLSKLEQLLQHFNTRFSEVFFVPGNHELWVRKTPHVDSIAKFKAILALCAQCQVHTQPVKLGLDSGQPLWIVPLFSWYKQPEEGDDSLYVSKPGKDETAYLWSDNVLCQWQSLGDVHPNDYFLQLNQSVIARSYDAPVISFSHFLPLSELVFPPNYIKPAHFIDPMPQFNFTRVAGSTQLHQQIQQLGSKIHIYGHQHRNRHTQIDGVTYISHCLGYPRERSSPSWRGQDRPKLIWSNGPLPIDKPY